MKDHPPPHSTQGLAVRPSRVGLTAAALLLPPLLALVMAVVHAADRAVPVGDVALLQILAHEASRGALLLGPYSRFGWSHPGPLLPYALAPGYWLSGAATVSLAVTAAALAVASIGAASVAWMQTARAARERSAFVALVALVSVTLSVGWQGTAYVQVWNPVVAVLPFLALLVACVAVLAGRVGWLPVACLLHAFVCQCHVGYTLPASTALALGAASAARREDRPVVPFVIAVAVLAVTWAPSLLDAAINRGGNAALLLHFFLADPVASEPERWAAALRAPLWFPGIARAGLDVPARLLAGLVAASIPVSHAVFRREIRAEPLLRALVLQAHAQLGAALIVVWSLPGEPHWYLLLFLKPVFFLCCLTLAVLALRLRRDPAGSRAPPRLAPALLITALAVVAQLPAAFQRPRPDALVDVAGEVRRVLDCVRPTGTPPVLLSLRDADAWKLGASIALHELERGREVVLAEEERYRFGPGFHYVPAARAKTFTPSLAVFSRHRSPENATSAVRSGALSPGAAVTFQGFGPRYEACASAPRP